MSTRKTLEETPNQKNKMSVVSENIKRIKSELPQDVTLVAVSKFHPVESLKEAYDFGQRVFGESRAQELETKAKQLPQDIEWHFIGHLQTNKIKLILPIVSLIHSVDSEKLLEAINAEAGKIGQIANVLFEIHVAKEESKYGFTFDYLKQNSAVDFESKYPNVRICGVMGMATNTEDEQEIRKEFKMIRSAYDELKLGYFSDKPYFKEISMGMSDDYKIAIEEGSTMVRIGSSIFGPRQY